MYKMTECMCCTIYICVYVIIFSCLRTVNTKPNQENLLGFEAVTAAGDLVADAGAGRL